MAAVHRNEASTSRVLASDFACSTTRPPSLVLYLHPFRLNLINLADSKLPNWTGYKCIDETIGILDASTV